MEYVAYEGIKFTVEWYFNHSGQSPAREFFNALDEKSQDKLLYLLKRIGNLGSISDKTKFRNEGDGIYAFKPKPDRYLCFFQKGRKIVITNAFKKHQEKLPKSEKERALANKQDYLKRTKRGEYYVNKR